jgi:hypothetical protein
MGTGPFLLGERVHVFHKVVHGLLSLHGECTSHITPESKHDIFFAERVPGSCTDSMSQDGPSRAAVRSLDA